MSETMPASWLREAGAEDLRDMADEWRRLAASLVAVDADHARQSVRLSQNWQGSRADSYATHARRLTGALEHAAGLAGSTARELDALADALDLDEPRFAPMPSPLPQPVDRARIDLGSVEQPEPSEQVQLLREETARTLRRIIEEFAALTDEWAGRGRDGEPGWDVPREMQFRPLPVDWEWPTQALPVDLPTRPLPVDLPTRPLPIDLPTQPPPVQLRGQDGDTGPTPDVEPPRGS